ncbi:hypothetical protein GCM10029992_27390 [Glycomyces albus]
MGVRRPQHTVTGSVSFLNKAQGFYANYHTVANNFFNNTAYDNHPNFSMRGIDQSGNTSIGRGTLRNNIAYTGTATAYMNGTDSAYNSWDLAVQVSASDFQSVSTSGWDAPRQADGSLPELPNLRLAEDSDLIDAGTDVGLPYAGAAPDLGAFEFGGGVDPGDEFVRYEAEDAPAVCDGTIETNHSGYSGSGFCDTPNETGTAAAFTVEAEAAGEATVRIRFANGSSGGARGADLVVNGATVASPSFEDTGSWSTWGTKTATVELDEGNTIGLVATGADGLPNIDYLDVDANEDTGDGEAVRYEAEDAPTVCDGTVDTNHSGYSGSGFCNTPNETGSAVRFTVDAAEGTATVAIGYANGGAARGAEVVVNGATVATVSFAGTGAWATWATQTVTVTLNEGSNTIGLVATGADGLPNIDYLDA